MPGDAPEMEPEFVRLVEECQKVADQFRLGLCQLSDLTAVREKFHRWHRAEVERAVRAAVAPFEALAREVCPEVNTCDDYPAPFVCQNDEGDAIIQAETPLAALRGILTRWDTCAETIALLRRTNA